MGHLDKTFAAMLQRSPSKGGWTYVVMPGSAQYFKTRGLVKIQGTVDGMPFKEFILWPWATVLTNSPIKAELRARIEKDVGDSVTIHLSERIEK